jgi:hypothetical protein
MNLEEKYRKIMDGITLGHRGLTRFNPDETQELMTLLKSTRESKNSTGLEKVLCLIEHSSMPEQGFEKELISVLNSDFPDHLIIFALNASRKHILQARFNKGNRLEFDFLETLKRLIHHRNPEVVEWTLRTIEECGNQGVYFLSEFDKIKPAPWKWFNAHQRAVRELITLLERRWRRFEKPEPQKP